MYLNSYAYYIMDYIDGPSLADIIKKKGPLKEEEAVGYILEVCEALKYVHSLNRMHMDIKPGNILIDKRAVLIDFGASKYYDEQSGEQTSTLLGLYTNGYAPLEQRSGTLKTFNPATDIYSLGATLYKLLTGLTPPDSMALVSRSEELKPLPSSISLPTRIAVEKAMEIFSKERPQTIDEFEKLLKQPKVSDYPEEEKTTLDLRPRKPAIFTPQYRTYPNTLDSESRDENQSAIHKINSFTQDEPRLSVSESINGHEFVDLGLPSGLKWATCNVGATKPEEYGDYFAWGEIKPKPKYDETNSETYCKGTFWNCLGFGSNIEWLKKKGYIDEKGNLSLSHDAAHQNWGMTWRMPTKDEINELKAYTTSRWTINNGVKGLLFESNNNGNSIFLPFSGVRIFSSLKATDEVGYYWSSTPMESNSMTAYGSHFYPDNFWFAFANRFEGLSVRSVSE